MRLSLLALTILFVVLVPMTIIEAEAAQKINTFISITREQSCAKTGCADPHILVKYDNSTQKISGHLVWSSKISDYTRTTPYKNSHDYYRVDSGKLYVFYNPDQSTLVRSKQIIISSLREFAPPVDLKKTSVDSFTDKRTTYQGAYVDPKCTYARVNMQYYPDLSLIITHLASKCSGDIGNRIDHVTAKTKLVYCGQECQHQKFMKSALEKSKSYMIESQLKPAKIEAYQPAHHLVKLVG